MYEDESEQECALRSEESSTNMYTFLLERCFEIFLQKETNFVVSSWGDGCFSCYGCETRVGISRVKCNSDLVKEFIDKVKEFCCKSSALSAGELQDILLHELIRQEEAKLKTLVAINKKEAYSQAIESEKVNQYIGEEYCLFEFGQAKYATTIDAWRFVLNVINECEYYDEIWFSFYENSICVDTFSYQITLPLSNYKAASGMEELNLRTSVSRYLPFCDDSSIGPMQQIAFSIPNFSKRLLILTEGLTDWKHISHAFSCSQNAIQMRWNEFAFEEFDESIQMGNDMLLRLCIVQSKLKRDKPIVAIFDCDNSKILKQVTREGGGFKDWGNHVYSLALPIPEHRKETPEISIEHYYSDDEIKTEYIVNGIPRRLFLGKEFDEYGRAPEIGRICTKHNYCGKEKIHIIDEKVFDSNSRTTINYALSKAEFAKHKICESVLSKEATEAFNQLGYKIDEILSYDQSKKRRK